MSDLSTSRCALNQRPFRVVSIGARLGVEISSHFEVLMTRFRMSDLSTSSHRNPILLVGFFVYMKNWLCFQLFGSFGIWLALV
jgi:hypothetical protein